MRKGYEKLMAEVITTGEPLSQVIVLAPRGSEGDNRCLEMIVEGKEICLAFTDEIKALVFVVALARKGIDMSWSHPFRLANLPVETGVWLDPSPDVVSELSVLDFIQKQN